MTEKTRALIKRAARNEITEHHIYKHVARRTNNQHNRELLEKMATQELNHYKHWRSFLEDEVEPDRTKIWFYSVLTAVLGLSFGLKLMEKGEKLSQGLYQAIGEEEASALDIMRDEQKHEKELLDLINEGFLQYVSSFVLGLNDALVELTGALAGLTLALQDTRLIGIVGLITGIAASMAMAGSEYLSTKEEQGRSPVQAGAVTGIAYFFTVILLIIPFFTIANAFVALGVTLAVAVLIILTFTFYTSVAKSLSFKRRFLEMVVISLGVAAINFGIAFVIKSYFGLEV